MDNVGKGHYNVGRGHKIERKENKNNEETERFS